MSVQIIDNVEIGEIPPTPISLDDKRTVEIAESSLLEIAKDYGFPIAYAQEQNGSVIQHVFPMKKTEKEQMSTSSKVELELHTETAFHPYKPDYVMLLCLRGDDNAATTYVCLEDLLGETDPEILYELTKEDFVTSIDKSFRMNGEEDKLIKTSIIQRREDGYVRLNYDSSVMHGITTTAQLALDEFKKIVSKNVKEFTLSQGQLAIIDNSATIHGRKDFSPRYDGTDRWLLRCLVRGELPPDAHRQGFVITTTF
jgi:L-asparagine oxygenase